MMRIQVVIVVALVAYCSGASIAPEEVSDSIQKYESLVNPAFPGSRNVISGIINVGDRLLHRGFYTRLAAATVQQTQEIRYTGATAIRITYISALAVGSTQTANAQITAGGVNTNNVTIRLTSAAGFGFHFWVEIWGR